MFWFNLSYRYKYNKKHGHVTSEKAAKPITAQTPEPTENQVEGICQAEAIWTAKSEVAGEFILMKMGAFYVSEKTSNIIWGG